MTDDWETVASGTCRLKVEGGWLYRHNYGMAFVPTKDPARPVASGSGQREAFPSIRRPAPASRALVNDIIDANYEEIPAHEVNGSEVTPLTRRD